MKSATRIVAVAAVFAAGLAVGALAAKKPAVTPAAFAGKTPAAAAEELLGYAKTFAENGSYENIAVARVYYLAGKKAEGQAILDRVMAGKTKPGDSIRIARLYLAAGEWAKAKPLFDSVVTQAPDDEDWLAEIGAVYYAQGDRARAEELFAASLKQDPSNLYNTLRMASAYAGVKPD